MGRGFVTLLFLHHFETTNLSSEDDGRGGLLDLGGDAVEIPASLGGEPAAAGGVLLQPLERLQGLEGLAGHGAAAAAPVGGLAAVVFADWKIEMGLNV